MSEWVKIIEAVKEPVPLAALSLLVLMTILRQVLQKITPIRGQGNLKLALSVVGVVGLLSLVIAVGAIGYRFYELSRMSARPALTRLAMETLLQKYRGSIEGCFDHDDATLYLDFVVGIHGDAQLNVDVFEGHAIGFQPMHPLTLPAGITAKDPTDGMDSLPQGDAYFVSGDLPWHPVVTVAATRKLGVQAPKVNKCILDTIGDSLGTYDAPTQPFVHRYITQAGITASREFRHVYTEELLYALEDAQFGKAREVQRRATEVGYKIRDRLLVERAEREYQKVLQNLETKEQYTSALSDMYSGDLLDK